MNGEGQRKAGRLSGAYAQGVTGCGGGSFGSWGRGVPVPVGGKNAPIFLSWACCVGVASTRAFHKARCGLPQKINTERRPTTEGGSRGSSKKKIGLAQNRRLAFASEPPLHTTSTKTERGSPQNKMGLAQNRRRACASEPPLLTTNTSAASREPMLRTRPSTSKDCASEPVAGGCGGWGR